MLKKIVNVWKRALAFARHRSKARTHYGLHSPFMFDMYRSCLRGNKRRLRIPQIEKVLKANFSDTSSFERVDFGAGALANKKSEILSNLAKKSSISRSYGSVLYRLCERYEPNNILELGTCLGVSTLYMHYANPSARILSMEGDPFLAEKCRQTFASLSCATIEVHCGNIDTQLTLVLEQFKQLDFVFFDANHRYEPTLRYFEECYKKSHENTIFVFDDIHWSDEMELAWEKIVSDERVKLSVDFFRMGLVFFRDKQPKQHFILR